APGPALLDDFALAVVAGIDRHDAVVAGKRVDDAVPPPVAEGAGGVAVHQHHPAPLVTAGDVADVDAVGGREAMALDLLGGGGDRKECDYDGSEDDSCGMAHRVTSENSCRESVFSRKSMVGVDPSIRNENECGDGHVH